MLNLIFSIINNVDRLLDSESSEEELQNRKKVLVVEDDSKPKVEDDSKPVVEDDSKPKVKTVVEDDSKPKVKTLDVEDDLKPNMNEKVNSDEVIEVPDAIITNMNENHHDEFEADDECMGDKIKNSSRKPKKLMSTTRRFHD